VQLLSENLDKCINFDILNCTHSIGKEGEFSLKVEQIISTNYIRVSYQDKIKDVIHLFISHYKDICCVFDHHRFIGIINKYSLYCSILAHNDINNSIQESINPDPITLNTNDNTY